MSSFVVASLIFTLLGSGATVDVGAGAVADVQAGKVALSDAQPSAGRVTTSVTLLSGMRVQSRRTTFELSYSPRFLVQFPNPPDLLRPLILHQLNSSYLSALSRRTSVSLLAALGAGEITYSAAQDLFDPGTGTGRTRIVPLAYATSTATIRHSATLRYSWDLNLTGGYRGPLDRIIRASSDPNAANAFPASYNVNLGFSNHYALTARDVASATAGVGYLETIDERFVPTGPLERLMAVQLAAGWGRALSDISRFDLTVGATWTYSLEHNRHAVFPTTSFAHSTQFKTGDTVWTSIMSGGIRGFLDRLNASYRPQLFAEWSLNGALSRTVSTGVQLFGATSLTSTPLVPERYETLASVRLPVTILIGDSSAFSFGFRGRIRAPHFKGGDDLRLQTEAIGFATYQYTLGTDPTNGAWLR